MIWYGAEAFQLLQDFISKNSFSRVFFLVDENTHSHCLPLLLRELENLPGYEILEVEPGEDSKSPEVLVNLWQVMDELEGDRQSLLINVGGGMITDLGGFLAGTYLRGIRFVNIPTSLLAMVDASNGGKTGINLLHKKNRVGLFLNPDLVCVVPDFLESLPERERLSGFAEMLKHGLIADKKYWEQLAVFDIYNDIPGREMIRHSIEIKQSVTEKDFRESGPRKMLNFGHTVGHALETFALNSAKPVTHGEAVAWGMVAELELSVSFAGMDKSGSDQVIETIKNFYAPIPVGPAEEMVALMRSDKKNVAHDFRFSLLSEIGKAVVDVEVDEQAVTAVLQNLQRHSRG